MKKYFGILAVLGVLVIPMIFNSCQATHIDTGYSSLSSSSVCTPQIISGALPVWSYVRANLQCATCHFQGTSAAPGDYYFADPSSDSSMQAFANLADTTKGGSSTKWYDKVFTAHYGGAGDTTTNHAGLDPLKAGLVAAGDAYNSCVSNQNSSGSGGGTTTNLNPTKQTMTKIIPANPTTAVNLVWNLGTEMQTAGSALPGAMFRVTIQSVVSTSGVKQYYVTAPQAQGATAGALQIRNIRVFINGALVALNNGGGTWTSLNNLAPIGRLHPLPQGSGVMILQADTALATNTIAIGFGTLEVSTLYPDFNPTTYTRLTSTAATIPVEERVFSTRCLSCHGTSGGMSLAAGGLALLKVPKSTGVTDVVGFNPATSEIYKRITKPAGDVQLMPQAGALPAAEVRWVRDWLLDGAPN